jgi:AraC-like DNA-binding protein
MVHYRYEQVDLVTWQENLAKLLEVEKKQNFFALPTGVGEGIVYACPLLKGITLLYINTIFHQPVLLDRLASKDGGIMLYFNQVDIEGEYKVISGDQIVIDRDRKRETTFLGSSRFPWQLNYGPGTHLRAIAIRFSESLVKGALRGEKLVKVQEYTDQNLFNVDREPLTPELVKLLNEIYLSDVAAPFGQLVLQIRALLLIEKYLNNFFLNLLPISKNVRISKQDLDRLAMVEELLSKDSDSFPTIEKLSKVAMMSCTKLKKRFKEIYGMKLYEYYNHNRLIKARALLETGEASVKEAALEIGFANLSNFSKAFKKEFGLLPKQLKSINESYLAS